jgi:hypothetical protein
LPFRFLRSVNMDLEVATGHAFEPMKEFLVDIVGERVCGSRIAEDCTNR